MFLLTVKEFKTANGKAVTGKEGEFNRAWFRLANEETNQTIDYSLIKKIEIPEDYKEEVGGEEEKEDEEGNKPGGFINSLTYVAGVVYSERREGQICWVFESLKNLMQAKDYMSLSVEETLADIFHRGFEEYETQ